MTENELREALRALVARYVPRPCAWLGCVDRTETLRSAFCPLHRHRLAAGLDLDTGEPCPRPDDGGPCLVWGCDRPIKTRCWCGMHYGRWHTHGDPLRVAAPPKPVVLPRRLGGPVKVTEADRVRCECRRAIEDRAEDRRLAAALADW